MSSTSTRTYGDGRRTRTNVAYADVERAAIAILKSERRPTVETVREALGRGSNDTIGEALRRFWRDLGARAEGDPAALTRMPVEIAELADGVWQRALKLASESARNDDNAARERLERIQVENDLKATSFALREAEWDTAARERERALADSREHLLLTLKALNHEQAAVQARELRITDLEAQVEQFRAQISALITAAVMKNRVRAKQRGLTVRSRRRVSRPVATKGGRKKAHQKPKPKRRR